MARQQDLRAGAHVVYFLVVHLVFVTKYRRKVISQRVHETLLTAWVQTCIRFGCTLMENGAEMDHAHLLVAYPPKVCLSRLVQHLKGLSARKVRKRYFPEVRAVLKGPAFWSPSYCAVSCGGAPLEIIKEYVRTQAGVPSIGTVPASTAGAASSPDVTAVHVRGIRGFEVPQRFKR